MISTRLIQSKILWKYDMGVAEKLNSVIQMVQFNRKNYQWDYTEITIFVYFNNILNILLRLQKLEYGKKI
jgi:hypothetical protein